MTDAPAEVARFCRSANETAGASNVKRNELLVPITAETVAIAWIPSPAPPLDLQATVVAVVHEVVCHEIKINNITQVEIHIHTQVEIHGLYQGLT